MKITPEMSEILGLLCAEGSYVEQYSSYWGKDKGKDRYYKNHKSVRIEFYSKDENLRNHFLNLLSKEFNYHPKLTKNNKINICKRSIIRELLSHTELNCESWQVPELILKESKDITIAFLRGFFDGDGTSSRSCRFFSINKKGLNQVSVLLKNIQIKHYFEKPFLKEGRKLLYSIRIPAKEREKFLNMLRPISKISGLRG